MNVAFASLLPVGFSFPQILLTAWSLPLRVGGSDLLPGLLTDSFPQVSVIFFLFCHFLFLRQIPASDFLGEG